MSEYQYHEWQTVERVLTPAEQTAVEQLSSHIEVSSSLAVVTYNWGDFKHDPRQVLLKYFDAYFYTANWSNLRLMFRFPKDMLKESDFDLYNFEHLTLETSGNYQVLEIDFSPEDGGNCSEAQGELSDFILLRADLLAGDYRLLYLARLKAMVFHGVPKPDEYEPGVDEAEEEYEPPVPPGLKQLTPALNSFIQVFDLDPFLVMAAAENSPDMQPV